MFLLSLFSFSITVSRHEQQGKNHLEVNGTSASSSSLTFTSSSANAIELLNNPELGQDNDAEKINDANVVPRLEKNVNVISCIICEQEMKENEMKDHVLKEHINENKCSIRVCRIEKCQKCILNLEGLVIHHQADEDEEVPDISDYNKMFDKSLVTYYTGVQV